MKSLECYCELLARRRLSTFWQAERRGAGVMFAEGGEASCLAALQFACERLGLPCAWEKLDCWNWACLLRHQPQFALYCSKWDEMNDQDINRLLGKRPELKLNFLKERLRKIEASPQKRRRGGDSQV